jgi:hypothetical protein
MDSNRPWRGAIIEDGVISLNCHNLEFSPEPGIYKSRCSGDDWIGFVTYRDVGNTLNQLDVSLTKKIRWASSDYLVAQIVMYPILIWASLVLSALTWLIAKAIRYVRNGPS